MIHNAVPALLRQGEISGRVAMARELAASLRKQAEQYETYAQSLEKEIPVLKQAADTALAQSNSTSRGASVGRRVVLMCKGAAAGWRDR